MIFRNSKNFIEENDVTGLDELSRVTVLNDNEPDDDVRVLSVRIECSKTGSSLDRVDSNNRWIRFSKDMECEICSTKVRIRMWPPFSSATCSFV